MSEHIILKPLTVAREELYANFLNLINNSGIHYFIIEDMLRDLTEKVHTASVQQLERDKKEYEAKLSAVKASNTETPQS